ncbi:MAG: FMN-binding protein [Bacteroidales bacterium]|nr:FMN-binding protein [Bacteroidales bacterium]
MDKKKRNGSLYTFLYAAILVTVTAALLAFVSEVLRPRQTANRKEETRQSILRSVHLEGKTYEKYIKDTVVGPQQLPLYICTLNDGSRKYIVPLRGKGLWGPLWGYMALNADGQTVYGADFDHQAETPGLGAEVSSLDFSAPFSGKSLYRDSVFVSIAVRKQSGKAKGNPNAVDGISGGTITSRGIEDMIRETLAVYLPVLKTILQEKTNEKTHLP